MAHNIIAILRQTRALCTGTAEEEENTLVYVAKHVGSGEPGKLIAKDGMMVAFFSNERSGPFNRAFEKAEILIVKICKN